MNDTKEIFLSYNWGIKESVKKLETNLKTEGFTVWLDTHELRAQHHLHSQIERSIENSRVFICCITQKYCESENCGLEFHLAYTLKKPMIVLMIEDLKIEDIIDIKVKDKNHSSGIAIKIK